MTLLDIISGPASLVSPECVANEALEYLGLDWSKVKQRSLVDIICGPDAKNGPEAVVSAITRLTFDGYDVGLMAASSRPAPEPIGPPKPRIVRR